MRRRTWTAPPGWPIPPAGWQPPSGWAPDPSWPPAPGGWQFWTRSRQTLGQRLGLVGIIAGAAVVLALVVADITDQAHGCGSIDPTDPANYSTITILNDTDQTVVVDKCRGAGCHPDALPAQLRPGQAFHDQAGCGESGSAMTSWSIDTPQSTVVGYIAVDSPRSTKGLVYRVSRASPNRTLSTPHD